MAWIRIEQGVSPRATQNSEGLAFGLIVAVLAALAAMIAAVTLAGVYPSVDGDDAVALGIAGSLFVLLGVVALVGYFVVLGFRRGQGILAAKRSMAVLLLGLPAAAVVGVLPWLGHRLVVAMPWMAHFPWGIVFALSVLLFSYVQRRRRKAREPEAPR